MVSTNIQRAPVVKLAVLGDESDNGSYRDLARYLSDFKYTLISEGGSSSYKFEIELINMDESFAQSLLSAFTMALGNQDPTDVKAVATASPVLAIQWGYKDALSNVHLARISDISYKFSQAKEKILQVTCVDNGDMMKNYSELSVETADVQFSIDMQPVKSFEGISTNPVNLIPIKSSLERYDNPIRFFGILKEVIGQLMYALPGYVVSFDNIPQDSIDRTYSEIITHFTKMSMIEFFTKVEGTGIKGMDPNVKNSRINFSQENTLDETLELYHRTNKMWNRPELTSEDLNKVKFEAWKKLFKLFDLEIENFTDFGKVQGATYIPLKRQVVADSGKDGVITSYVPLHQLKDSSKLSDITLVVKAKAINSLTYIIPHSDNHDNDAGAWIENAINIWNSDFEDVSAPAGTLQDAAVEMKMTEPITNMLETTSIFMVPDVLVFRKDDGVMVRLDLGRYPSLRQSMEISKDLWAHSLTSGESEPILDIRNSLAAACHKKEQESIVKEVFTKEQQEQGASRLAEGGDGDGSLLTFTQLPLQEQSELLYSDLATRIISKKGQTLEKTVQSIIDTHNTLMLDPNDDIQAEVWPITQGESFHEVLLKFKGEEKIKSIPTSMYVILPKGNEYLQKHLKPISSFSHLWTHRRPNVIKLSYGTADSIVKHFDFDGDMRYLMNLLAQVTMEKTFETYAEHLTTTSIKTVVYPMLDYIIQDKDFVDALEKQGLKGREVLKLLKALASRIDVSNNTYPETEIDSIKDLGIAIEHIESMSASSTGGNFDDAQLSTTVKFLQAISNNIIAAAMFKPLPPSKGVAKGLAGTKAYIEYVNPQDEAWKKLAVKTAKTADEQDYFSRVTTPAQANYLKVQAANRSEQYSNQLKASQAQEKIIMDGIVEPANPYILKSSNIFDTYNTSSLAFSKDSRMAMGWYKSNIEQVWELKVKTLGIPEIDHMIDVSTPRVFQFEVHDLSKEKDKDKTNIHWLTGDYRPIGISHHISPSIGYVSDFKLLKTPFRKRKEVKA